MERAKVPLLQEQGIISLKNNISESAKLRATLATPEERAVIDSDAMDSINLAAQPPAGVPAIIGLKEQDAFAKQYKNEVDLQEIDYGARQNAADVLKKLDGNYFKNITLEQKVALRPRVEKIANDQEQDAIYAYAVNKFKDDNGNINYTMAAKWVNSESEKAFGVKPENRKAVAEMLYAQTARTAQINDQLSNAAKANVLNEAYGYALKGDARTFIRIVSDSGLDNTTKFEIIDGFKTKGIAHADDPVKYNDLMRGVVDGTIYNEVPILTALASGQIRETTKDALLQTLKQRQEPSFTVYQNAVKQVDRVYDKGIMGNITDVESAALSYIKNDLNAQYLNALAQKKSIEEIQKIFSPDNVSATAAKYAPTVSEAAQAYIKRIAKPAAKTAEPAPPSAPAAAQPAAPAPAQASPAQTRNFKSIADFDKEYLNARRH